MVIRDRLMARLDEARVVEPRRIGQYMYYTYILKSELKRKSYVGHTNNIQRRLLEHNEGKNTFTKKYRPWRIIYVEQFKNEQEAINKEKYFKSHAGRKIMKKLFEEYGSIPFSEIV